jgi:phage host-nuclease inhibitor protein Gam
MATPHLVARKLREPMGEEAGASMVDWLDDLDAHNRDLRHDMHADIAELRQEMHAEFAKVRREMQAGLAGVRLENVAVREEMRVGFETVRREMAEQGKAMTAHVNTLLKWGLGLWVTSFAAMVALLALVRGIR